MAVSIGDLTRIPVDQLASFIVAKHYCGPRKLEVIFYRFLWLVVLNI